MAGPLKTLFGALGASTFLSGVSLVFGDEEINTQRFPLPLVVMTPRGGQFTSPGYVLAVDPNVQMLWQEDEAVELWLWNASTDLSAQGAIDHTDAIESLRALVLSALQDQLAQYTDAANPSYGLYYKPLSGRWETVGQNAPSRFGRAYVLTVQISIPIVMPPPTEATITTVTITAQT